MIRLQYLDEHYIVPPNIFNVMCHALGDVPTIPRMIVKRPRCSLCRIYTDPRIASYEEVPLVTSGVPVDLTHSSGMHRDNCGREFLSDGEGFWIEDFDSSTGGIMSERGFGEVVGVGKLLRNNAG